MNHPIDIAYSLNNLISEQNHCIDIEEDLTAALYDLKAIAENPLNSEYWRTLYNALSLIADIPDYAPLPF